MHASWHIMTRLVEAVKIEIIQEEKKRGWTGPTEEVTRTVVRTSRLVPGHPPKWIFFFFCLSKTIFFEIIFFNKIFLKLQHFKLYL